MSFLEITGKCVNIRINKDDKQLGDKQLSFEWKIRNFFSHTGREGYFYTSPGFYFCDADWRLKLFPFGQTQNLSSEYYVSLYLQRRKPWLNKATPAFNIPKVRLRITVGIKSSDGMEKVEGGAYEFTKYNEEYGWPKLWRRSDLRNQESRLVPDSILTIRCVLIRDVPGNVSDDSTQPDDKFRDLNTLSGEKQFLDKKGTEQFVQDIGELLVSGENSDVTLKVRDTEFKVHRAILSARCPVLGDLIHTETAEKASGKISMNDCDPDVFEVFLRYIYTGSVQLHSQQTLFRLYRLANVYQADSLREQCLGHIRSTLCVRTICDTLKHAWRNMETNLYELAVEFAAQNIRLVIQSEEWRHFNREYPSEAIEILTKSLGLPCKCKKTEREGL